MNRWSLVLVALSLSVAAASACGRTNLKFLTGSGGAGGAGLQGGDGGMGLAGGEGGAGNQGGGGGMPFCGDGNIDSGEDCDDGNQLNNDSCVAGCQMAECGDGFVWQGVEACDDGNAINDDGCKNNCALPTCGDAIVDAGEDCDDGNLSNQDDCLNTCLAAFCGDAFVHTGVEQCDDGNTFNGDSCVSGCVQATCGDGFVWNGVEECDDGNNNNFDACRNGCTLPFCGDAILDPGEACDDGNNNNFDACRNDCTLPFCGDSIVDPGEQCDDGNNSNSDACVVGCVNAVCGDGFLWLGMEQCDDGNLINGDGCSATCMLPICGDGLVEGMEQCDLGALNADRPALEIEQGPLKQGVVPHDVAQDAAVFYNYFSASSHTGFEQVSVSRIYFYVDVGTGILSLIMHHGIDQFPNQPQANVGFTITGVPAVASVALADDAASEFFKQTATTVIGDWFFANNTDGGVLTSLPFPGNWTMTLAPTFQGGINTWQFVDDSTNFVGLNLTQNLIMRAFDSPSACRTDCTIPTCGDGVLDGGEVCDDGNTIPNDGCAPNCLSF